MVDTSRINAMDYVQIVESIKNKSQQSYRSFKEADNCIDLSTTCRGRFSQYLANIFKMQVTDLRSGQCNIVKAVYLGIESSLRYGQILQRATSSLRVQKSARHCSGYVTLRGY